MAQQTGIGWCHHTFNGVWGCTEVSPGCDHCYARIWAERYGLQLWGPDTPRRQFGIAHWRAPLAWNRRAAEVGERRRVFAYSMGDVFEGHPTAVEILPQLWETIRATPWLDWLLLTKRHGRIARSLPADWGAGYPNVWLGVSAESQAWADRRIPALLDVPAVVRWVSLEPLLGPVDLRRWLAVDHGWPRFPAQHLDWVVVGGESTADRRMMDLADLTRIHQQTLHAPTPLYVKQDSAYRDGQQGRITAHIWSRKEYPVPRVAA